MAVYVQFNRFIDLTKNSHANPYHLASTELTVVRAGCPVCLDNCTVTSPYHNYQNPTVLFVVFFFFGQNRDIVFQSVGLTFK